MTSLDRQPVTQLKGVGTKVAEKLQRLGIYSIQDLLFHLPLRYEDRTRIYPICDLQPGISASVCGEIQSSDIAFGKRRMLVVNINDGTGGITLRFFHFSAAQKNNLESGKQIKCFGEIRRGKYGLEISHPEYSFVDETDTTQVNPTLTPVYPTTDGLKQISLRNIAEQAIQKMNRLGVTELFPEGLFDRQQPLQQALNTIHQPPPDVSMEQLSAGSHPAQQRLILEELAAQQLGMLKLRQQTQQFPAPKIAADAALEGAFLAQLGFDPTSAQCRVIEEIANDLTLGVPMMRLVQGDVGSGKTLVAAMAALKAISAGFQVALMAPTEILAEQHAENFKQWFSELDIAVGWLAGKLTAKQKRESLHAIANNQVQLVVGTHALFQQDVEFANLALVIIDEQHRFGVHQRLMLREKGAKQGMHPHQLIMTATPIPRTLSMSAYADLDTSIIDELPPGRTPVTTVAIPDTRREQIIERVKDVVETDKRQVYWVCTLIEESEVLQCQAAEDTAEQLQQLLPNLRIGLVHGRMKAAEKQQVMQQFKDQQLDLLVATTVIEVGVNVPNASLMIIENPERLGLAQLHQLRGRVGRGSVASHCVLLFHHPLSKTAQKRLGVLRDSNDGFVIAQKDLEIRGPGEVLGTKQTGVAQLRIADLERDADLLPQAQNLAYHLWEKYPANAQAIINRWLGHKEVYSNA
jgi:ATP-dependent DNA helicase RecG